MNILGMGPLEILLIVVLALIVFGPAKLPEIMGQVGKAIADFRRATSELSDEFNRTIQAELNETKALVDDTRSTVSGVHTSINSALTGTPAPTLTTPAPNLTAAPANGVSVSNGTTLEAPANGTNGTAPPLATTAQWSWETAAPAPTRPAIEVADVAPDAPAPAPTVTSPPPVSAPEPAPRTRKSNVRNDVLPPY